ncbi:hypothetical protein HOLleu_06558 [Holothuria leucospilota]|uniref:Uncharacterized protein n=1 Tax=Holothuria leucospilota TaxID=206669 RepID=A0A9Q1HF84_HOLLE|nr:hypothetical protein HOLleu_06558 [Holothuria leucospilota]
MTCARIRTTAAANQATVRSPQFVVQADDSACRLKYRRVDFLSRLAETLSAITSKELVTVEPAIFACVV